ncbi:MAG TPA: DUF6600 domain-containing protein, partial [Terriglobia bacterium]
CLLPWLVAASLGAQDQGSPPGRVARLSFTQGNVSFQPSGESQWSTASPNYTVSTGDRLYTDQGARVELEVGPFAVRMSQTTDLTLVNLNDQLMQLGLGQGSVRVTVYELPQSNSVEIDTPNGALTIQQPGSYRVDIDPNQGSTLVSVNGGSLEVTGGGISQPVNSGQAAQLTGTGPIQVNLVALPNPDDFDQWCASRDRRIESYSSRQYVNPYTPGAEDLDQYGQWNTVPQYGPVWYPAGVAAGWVPYRVGHWAWVEPWGWTWVETEPWGFCPFHYGRWAFIGSRWGWMPGPVAVVPFYSPALVAFVGGSGFSVGVSFGGGFGLAAWFPLGPSEPFIPWYHYTPTYLRQVNITNVRNVTVINNYINTTNINVTNIKYQYKTVGVTAVSGDVLRSGQPVAAHIVRIPPEQIAKAQVIAHPAIAPAQTAVFGGRAPVKAPPVRAAVTAPPRVAVQVTRGGQPAERPTPEALAARSAPPPAEAHTPAPAVPERSPAPATNRVTPAPTSTRAGPPAARPAFVTKTPPPERDVPFAQHETALQQHPGRPLEPQQEQNLRQGRPAGPPQDREVLPHEAAPKPAPRPEPKPAPKPK